MAKKKVEKTEEILNTVEEVAVAAEPEKKPVAKAKPKKKVQNEGIVNVASLNVRADASMKNPPIGLLHSGDKVTIIETLGEWTKIDGGFVMSEFISKK